MGDFSDDLCDDEDDRNNLSVDGTDDENSLCERDFQRKETNEKKLFIGNKQSLE